jgi:multiple sugar transport system permease protein
MSQTTVASRSSAMRAGGPPADRRRRSVVKRGRPLWMLIPGAVLLAVIILIPLVMAIWMSLLDLSQYTIRQWLGAPFAALQNYVVVITQTQFFQSLAVSIGFAVLATVFSIPIGVAAAVVTHNAFRGRAAVRSLFLVPYVIPSFVVATIWRTIMQPGGVWTGMLSGLGIRSSLWLNGPNAFWTLVIVEIWASWPFIYLLTLAGLQTIEHQVFEAAALDGVTWGRQLRSIVFPNIGGPLALACVVSVLSHINNFTLPYVLFGIPAPDNVQTLPFLTYIQSFTVFRFGLGAATAVLSLVLLAIPLIVYLRMMRLDVGKEA